MAKDAELDRLKAAQDLAFQRKQDAYQAQQRAWEKRSSTRDAMNHAFEAKQRAYAAQESTWQDLQRMRDSYGPRIEQLNSLQETAFQNMGRAFGSASSAHDRRDGAGAASYAAEGHRYKAESQGYVNERRGLVAELRSAKERHDATKPAFQRAKDDFSSVKRTFDSAKAEHERAQTEFKRAKADFDSCAKSFKSRLEKVKAEGQKHREGKKSIAAKAGVPYQYRDDVWISTDSNGNINIYFGGVGEPNGPGHGHYVMDRNGNVTYKRDPFDPHGTQNFTEDNSPGGTLYDRRVRASKTPTGIATTNNTTGDRSGTFYDRSRDIDLHVTQYYDDKTHVSWDTDGKTDRDRHWTNQRKKSHKSGRHTPPPDARK